LLQHTPGSIDPVNQPIGVDKTMTELWRELYQYWRDKRVGDRPPSRDQIDPPVELPHLAHNLMLVDVTPQGLEYRLVGTNFAKGAGIDMTGMAVGESGLHAHVIAQWSRAMKEAIQTGEARLLVGRFAPHITATTEMLLLPLRPSADGIPKILGGLFVTGTFPPNTEIEALEFVPIVD
jgi:hypothetical protein